MKRRAVLVAAPLTALCLLSGCLPPAKTTADSHADKVPASAKRLRGILRHPDSLKVHKTVLTSRVERPMVEIEFEAAGSDGQTRRSTVQVFWRDDATSFGPTIDPDSDVLDDPHGLFKATP